MATIPDNLTGVFEPSRPDAGDADLGSAVCQALEMLDCSHGLTVLVNDPQRQTNTRAVLVELAGRVDPAGIRILVATGSHRFSDDHRKSFARDLTGDLPLKDTAWHDCCNDDLSPIGPGGTWRGHRWLTEEPALLAIGSVEPHYFAAFTGAHKTATVGCASYKDIRDNHAGALSPHCRPCHLDGNPVHAGICHMLEALWHDRPVAAVNLVQLGEQTVGVFAGNPISALEQAAKTATEIFARRIQRPADVIIAEVTGPLGQTFYQADKGIKNNEWAVRDTGTIILVAPCDLGVGQDHFLHLLRKAGSYDQAVEFVDEEGYQLGDHKAVRLRYLTDPKCRGVRVMVVSSGLTDHEAEVLGVITSPTVADALSAAGVDPQSDRVYLIKDAGHMTVLPEQM